MRCPFCGSSDSRVTDSRDVKNGIRRRRECQECQRRFTTYERIHAPVQMVTKRDNRREEFDREKLVNSILKACAKRPVSASAIEKMADDIEGELQDHSEVATSIIGEAVMEQLKDLDRVAYIRFASVYRDFQDIDSFERAVQALREGGGAQLTLPQIQPGPRPGRRQAGATAEPRRRRTRRPDPETENRDAETQPAANEGAESNQEAAAETDATANGPPNTTPATEPDP